jgi:MFS family permease
MCTAVLPLYLSSLGLGPAALGLIEGVADFLVSMSKLAGGVVGHHVRHKRPLVSIGYLTTALATWGIAFVHTLTALVSLRSVAWIGRGFRGPLRDYMLADAVPPTHYGRAYGLERAGDMLGAVAGPLIATLLVWGGVAFRTVILWTVVPGLLAAASIFFLTRERELPGASVSDNALRQSWRSFPRAFWIFLIGVLLFGLGDFSRTFLIWLAVQKFDGPVLHEPGTISLAILLYAVHNLVSAGVAYPVGHLGDRTSKLHILLWGYGLGVATNVLLAFLGGSVIWLIGVFVLSGSYIAVEETLEKAVAAEMLPRELRSLGFGLLAFANAGGDMISSIYVGFLLEVDRPGWAFSIAATVGMVGVVWLLLMRHRLRPGFLKVS